MLVSSNDLKQGEKVELDSLRSRDFLGASGTRQLHLVH